jgi:hypothetical protein
MPQPFYDFSMDSKPDVLPHIHHAYITIMAIVALWMSAAGLLVNSIKGSLVGVVLWTVRIEQLMETNYAEQFPEV